MHKLAQSAPAAGPAQNPNSPPDRLPAQHVISQPEEKTGRGRHAPAAEESAIPTAAAQSNGRAGQGALAGGQIQETASATVRGRTLGQILIILVVALLLVNVPIGYRRAGLVQSVPEATPVIIYDGMVLQGSGPERYILDNHKLRRFSSPDTFRYFHRRYDLEVHPVDDDLLRQFEGGRTIYRLVACNDLPYVYALENGQKRRLKTLPFPNQAGPWDSVGQVTCNYLADIPTGPPLF